ncbi:unnamed protein product [Rotaria magnacalcarata]|uniref:Uncharacterized protein n=2 Tax=Rotaria magnacalcarata TaxID=392030 RepID=A0A816D5T0_9BILA|nr:unnamed protein product [Rotaria magnacalcarata]CAF3763044.1 unnamed protein product [Rotaria magnacalcarata]CAF3768799.1 unnamed protein product [Rotaria magnacalcarata]
MNSNSLNKTLVGSMKCTRSSSPTIISSKHKTNSLLTSCCGCSCTREQSKSIDKYRQSDNRTTTPKEDTKCDVHRGFFKRIQYFKAQKRQSTARKQQLAAAATISATRSTSPISNGHSIIEPERLLNDSDEHSSNIISASSSQDRNESFINNNYSHHPMRNAQSIPLLLNRHDNITTRINSIPYGIRGLNNGIDSYSFTDIEATSSINDNENDRRKRIKSIIKKHQSISTDLTRQTDDDLQSGTPNSLPSRDLSSVATNLSSYSTQSLLRRLIDKAQVLNEYYNDVCTKTAVETSVSPTRKRSLSPSTNSLLGRNGVTPRSLLHRDQSCESIRKSRRQRRSLNDNMSADSSRFNLYADEDNVLRELISFNNDIDLILSRLEMEGENIQQTNNSNDNQERCYSSSTQILLDDNDQESTVSKLDDLKNLIQQANIYPSDDSGLAVSPQINDREETDQTNLQLNEVITMRTNTNEINIHLLLSNDINRLREAALSKLLKLTQQNCNHDTMHNHETITLAKLNKLPKSITWKGKRVFGVPLRVYQQTTGQILPVAITNALQYVRMNAGKCEGLFRKPGVKSKIDRLRSQIETTNDFSGESLETIKFDEYQPFVVADVIRQYFRELPECLMPPSITRLLCDLLKCVSQEEQLLAIRYTFLLLPDETRDVLETILRFLLDVSIRSGNSQTTCRSLARIFVPSVFQSYHDMHTTTSKVLWWKWKKDKLDAIQQESERLTLEHCLMTMILNVDLLCRVPSSVTDELKLPTARKTKRLDDLVRTACNGEFHMKKYIAKDSEQFLQRLSNTKFKNIPTNLDSVHVAIHKPSSLDCDKDEINLPMWKCSIDIPNTNVKQVSQRILHERYLWDNHFAESRTVEKIDDDKEIVQYVLNFLDLVPVRSFCEFRFSKKIASRSIPDTNAMLISAVSIDHLQNHFLPGSIGVTKDMHYYITPSTTQPGYTTVIQVASVDFSGRSSQWYENVFGCLLAHNLISLRDTFTNSKIAKV